MKKLQLILLLFIPLFVWGQSDDNDAIAAQIDSMFQSAIPFGKQGKFDEVMVIYEAATKLAEENFGTEHPVYADCMLRKGYIFYRTEKYEDAERLYLQAKDIREKVLGDDHPDYASILNSIGVLYVRQGRYAEAEPIYGEAIAIMEKEFGKESLQYGSLANSMANLYERMARFDEAEKLHLEIKDIKEKLLGKEDPEYINTLENLGNVYYRNGYFEEAEKLYLEVKEWSEKNLGKEHIEYTYILSNLSNLYIDMGKYEEAERMYVEVKDTQEKTIGTEDADYAFTLTYLGDLYISTGKYEQSEEYLLKAKNIYEKTLGKDHPEYAVSVELLASLYFDLGLYKAAEPLYREVRTIREKQLGTSHPDYASALNNLARLYSYMSQRDSAVQLYQESKAIFEKEGKENDGYLWSLNNLAVLHTEMGDFEKAETYLKEVRATREKMQGKDHPDYANILEDLSMLYRKMGDSKKALPLQQEAVDNYEKTLGKNHFRYARNLNNLAGLYHETGQGDKAGPLYLEAGNIQRNLLIDATQHLSERELAAYTQLFAEDLDGFLAFMHENHADGKHPAAGYDNALFHKGFLLTAANQVKQLTRSDKAVEKQLELLASYQRRIASEYARPLGEREGVNELEQKANAVEKELVRTVAGYGKLIKQVTWKEVQEKLKPDEAAVEFIHYNARTAEGAEAVFYSALVLLPGEPAPRFVSLCDENALNLLFGGASERRSDYVSDLYSFEERGASGLDQPQKSLYELLWEPLADVLKDTKTIYYSPSGLLHRLNLGAIPLDEEEALSDYFNFVLMGSTRQVVVPYDLKVENQEILLVGGVNYEMDSAAIAERNIPVDALAARGLSEDDRNLNTVNQDQNASAWSYIKWTQKEVKSLESIVESSGLTPNVKSGNAASEEMIKEVGQQKNTPRVIHLATHGFFFPDPATQKNKNTGKDNLSPGQQSVFRISDQPMIRSGLILAGGNYAWLTGEPLVPGLEDGILTAYEISQMDLSGTELVVLSACETGLGDIKGNEGVYGLQRAFKIAGVKYIVMSLWEVPDLQTKKLMTNFYEKWLEEEMPVRDALNNAQKEMREFGFSPYQWAGFVLME